MKVNDQPEQDVEEEADQSNRIKYEGLSVATR